MNFGDILDKWENNNKADDKSAKDFAAILNKWEQTNAVYDKDAAIPDNQISAQEKRRRLRNKWPDAELDIHGQTRDEAERSLKMFFAESKEKGREKILIIHGKGNHSAGEPVLKRLVKDFIERCPFAGESGNLAGKRGNLARKSGNLARKSGKGKFAGGGEGATWVLLK